LFQAKLACNIVQTVCSSRRTSRCVIGKTIDEVADAIAGGNDIGL